MLMLASHPTNTFKYRLSSVHPNALTSLVGVRMRRVLLNFFAVFALENQKRNLKSKSSPASTSRMKFYFPAPTLRHKVVNFSCDHSNKHNERLRNSQPTLLTDHAQLMQLQTRTFSDGSINFMITHMCGSFSVLSDFRRHGTCSGWHSSASDKPQDRRTQNCCKNFVRFSFTWCVKCWMCLWLWNDREFTEGNDPHIFGTRIAVPDSSISVYVFFLLFAFAFFLLLPFIKSIKFYFNTSLAATFEIFGRRFMLFCLCTQKNAFWIFFRCLAFWLILVSLTFFLLSANEEFLCQKRFKLDFSPSGTILNLFLLVASWHQISPEKCYQGILLIWPKMSKRKLGILCN